MHWFQMDRKRLPALSAATVFLVVALSHGVAADPSPLDRLIESLEALEASPDSIRDLESAIRGTGEAAEDPSDEIQELETTLREIEKRQKELSDRIEALKTAQELLSKVAPESLSQPTSTAPVAEVRFGRDIKPILSTKCFACHGPDASQRKANLRFDLRENAMAPLRGGGFAISPGDPDNSEILKRVSTHDSSDLMPPPGEGEPLTAKENDLLRQWIAQGAEWEDHWAFIAPVRPEPPALPASENLHNEIDAFILDRLNRERLTPAPEADRETLIRRVSLDLLGLPPTLDERRRFLDDPSDDWYAKMVDYYLGSKHFGERMAIHWLDLARYADSDGYHIDYEKTAWQYRDWVIDAFNSNKPFDEFTIEQLAGDLLPNPSLDQMVATSFNRNGMTNTEGGADPAEYLTKYVIDRVVTTTTVWLGLTMACAECHEHKYDPITQEEFYQFYDFFNQLPESGLDKDPCPPFIRVPSKDQQARLEEYTTQLASLEKELEDRLNREDPNLQAQYADWSRESEKVYDRSWKVLSDFEIESLNGTGFERLDDGSILAKSVGAATDTYTLRFRTSEKGISGFRIEAIPDPSLPAGGSGLAGNGNFMLSGVSLHRTNIAYETTEHPISIGAAYADFEQDQFPARDILDEGPATGWAVLPQVDRYHRIVFNPKRSFGEGSEILVTLRLKFHHVAPEHLLGRFRLSYTTEKDPVFNTWSVLGPFPAETIEESFAKQFGPETELDLAKTHLDGDLAWVQRPEWTDGAIHNLTGTGIAATYLHRTVYSPTERKVLLHFGSNDGIQVWLNGESILSNNVGRPIAENQDKVQVRLRAGDNRLLMKINNHGGGYAFYFRPDLDLEGTEKEIAEAFRIAEDQRTEEHRSRLKRLHLLAADPATAELHAKAEDLRGKKSEVESSIPTIRVMQDMEEKRPTHVLVRGDYRNLGETVTAGTPAFLPSLPEGEPVNRLALAKWLVSAEQPLTARVTVNRIWEIFFGVGLVKTSEDFGTQGELPSHPELLDWLAVEFRETGWDVKALIRKILLSAAYRRESRIEPSLLTVDPENRLLARGPRYRLPAEVVRDNALAISGLLDRDRPPGGPSVKPYQPGDLWKEKAIFAGDAQSYIPDTGPNLYRRGLYTFWKRSVPYPAFVAFDAPSREVCTAKRAVTNTPLQAFVTLNETGFVEAARHFAQRILKEGGDSSDVRFDYAYQLALNRTAKETEKEILRSVLTKTTEAYQNNPNAALALLGVGESPRDESLDPVEHAAWTTVANLIFNLDETITKE